ncbi:KH domain-containing protein [Ditylenchus destructor]|uniref:KH domain-containing protein n=1 Tax=Ditylenchus destructor TaxID=166010 RepID=A0AAD4MNP9_9BILA|nr:KH domain-containing protein [Ditylenchus destructor]
MRRFNDVSDWSVNARRDRRNVGQRNSSRNQDFKLRLLIPETEVGPIIGARGGNAVAMQKKYNALISIPITSHSDRVVSITCHHVRVGSCFSDILTKLAEKQRAQFSGRRDIKVRLLVHESLAGAVIGCGGAQIRKFRQEHNCIIEVYRRACTNSTDQIILLEGSEESIVKAVESLVKFLFKKPLKGPERPYIPSNYDDDQTEDSRAHLSVGINAIRLGPPKRNISRGDTNTYSTSEQHIKNEPLDESFEDDDTVRVYISRSHFSASESVSSKR